MGGPVPAPAAAASPAVRAAGHLSYYASAGLGVLAPRGWHCLGLYGSGGASLLVTPRRYTAASLPGFNQLAGPAIEIVFLNGENSGRDQVAEVFARLFPAKRGFVREVARMEDQPRRYADGPFSRDRTTRRSRTIVDYTTPSHRAGMGTYASCLGPGAAPIAGTAILSQSNGVDAVLLLDVRLPPGLRGLTPVILATARTAALGHGSAPQAAAAP